MSGPFTELSNAQIISYATMASGAAVMYDQILNFSQEVDFIWVRRWTIVTALYFVARYCGPVSQFAVVAAVLPLNWTPAEYTSLAIVYRLSSIASVTAMQGVFLLRAHALCNRSRKVLVFLSVSFVCEMVVMVVVIVKSLELVAMGWLVTFMGPDGRVLIGTNATLDLWQQVSRVIQLVYDILLLVFALFGSVKHALEARGWCVNPLVKALAEDQIAYIFWYAVWQGTSLPTTTGVDAGVSALEALNYLFGAFVIIAGPRMVISLRARELKTREGTSQTQLSTIRFNVRGSPSQLDAGEEPVHTHGSGSRREVDADA